MTELSNPITMRLPRDMLDDIEKIAAGSERTRSWVIVRALRHYLAQDAEGGVCLSVLRGREEAQSGGGEDMEDVIAELDEIIRKGKAA